MKKKKNHSKWKMVWITDDITCAKQLQHFIWNFLPLKMRYEYTHNMFQGFSTQISHHKEFFMLFSIQVAWFVPHKASKIHVINYSNISPCNQYFSRIPIAAHTLLQPKPEAKYKLHYHLSRSQQCSSTSHISYWRKKANHVHIYNGWSSEQDHFQMKTRCAGN